MFATINIMLSLLAHAGHNHTAANEATIPIYTFLIGALVSLAAIVGIALLVMKKSLGKK